MLGFFMQKWPKQFKNVTFLKIRNFQSLPPFWGCMGSNPDRTSEEKFASSILLPLQRMMTSNLTTSVPRQLLKQLKTFQRTMKMEWIWNSHWKNRIDNIVRGIMVPIYILSIEVANTIHLQGVKPLKKRKESLLQLA